MAFEMENRNTNVMFAGVSFWVEKGLEQLNSGRNTKKASKPISNFPKSMGVPQKLFKGNSMHIA